MNISRIVFTSTPRGSLFASKMHLISSAHRPKGTPIVSFGASKPTLSARICSLQCHAHDMSRQCHTHGFADSPISGISPSSNQTSKKQEAEDMHIHIVSVEDVKPESPTPDQLRLHKFSFIDQLAPHIYTTPLVFFYPNDQQTNITEVISERRARLKQSLSETLVSFYPLAGRIKDNVHIECNDDGAYYVEARLNIKLSDFLQQQHDNRLINRLLPIEPDSRELLSETHLLMIQISIFECGGIAIGVCFSHKVVDGISLLTFMKAWAAVARESSERILPSFISPSTFPPLLNLPKDSSAVPGPEKSEVHNYITKRFVFDRSALAALKAKATTSSLANPSSFTVVMGLLWKTFIVASKIRCGNEKMPVLSIAVNLRTRSSPPLPPNSFGNIVCPTSTPFMDDSNLDLKSLATQIRNAIATIDSNFVEGIKGEGGFFKLKSAFKDLFEMGTYTNAETFLVSSICKQGLYEADFGWGKPIWSGLGGPGTNLYGIGNVVFLMDTRSGDGIEAWVTIKEADMGIFEKNQDLLFYASLNPSCLES